MRLNDHQRAAARANILHGAHLMLNNAGAIHYSQQADRWEGIDHRLRVVRNQFPRHADCSSMATWMLWNALTHALRDMTIEDVVNGAHWRAGFTGTMAEHGKHIDRLSIVGDCALYGNGPPYKHVAVYIGDGFVFSHGSEAGPFKLPVHYRGDMRAARRYILAP